VVDVIEARIARSFGAAFREPRAQTGGRGGYQAVRSPVT
jgi:hypothetical protein